MRALLVALLLACLASAAEAASAPADGLDGACRGCHGKIFRKKVVHGAMQMPCSTCHDAVDTRPIPHKRTGLLGHGLSTEVPALCVQCHDKGLFEGAFVHAPVAGGQCLLCHDPHSSDQVAMLRKPPAALCLDCHAAVGESAHVLSGSTAGHPTGRETRRNGPAEDPLRPGRPFYCAGCHEPHRAAIAPLSRVSEISEACPKCHRS